MDERQRTLLRKKLEALSYIEPFEATSAPLVQRLVDDVVRTTESYRGLKLQCAKQAQEISTYNTKVWPSAGRSSMPASSQSSPVAANCNIPHVICVRSSRR